MVWVTFVQRYSRPALVNSWPDRGLRLQRRAVSRERRARGTASFRDLVTVRAAFARQGH